MKTKLLLLLVLFVSFSINAQSPTDFNKIIGVRGEYSKEASLFKAKEYLIKNIIDVKEDVVEFYVDPLEAASSGELTTLIYKCNKNIEGLLFVFYGNYWNEAGVIYQGYAFKNFNKVEATSFFKKMDDVLEEHEKFLGKDYGNNSITFKFDDMQLIVWSSVSAKYFRIFWNGFDSSWESTSFERTKKRFEKKMD